MGVLVIVGLLGQLVRNSMGRGTQRRQASSGKQDQDEEGGGERRVGHEESCAVDLALRKGAGVWEAKRS
jgi:hypothetical protein